MAYDVIGGKVVTPEGIELNVTYHCNLGCASCSHLSPLFRRTNADPAAAAADLALLSRSFQAQFVKVLGGEPLLHPELLTILAAVRESGIAPKILLCTNGILLPRMSEEFWAAVDEVEVSVYPGRELSPDDARLVRQRAERSGTELRVEHYSYFRYSYSEVGTDDPELVSEIYSTCQIAHVWRCHTVFEGYFFKCPQSVFLPRAIGSPADPWADGLEIEQGPGFVDRLLAYLRSSEPLAACRNCLGSAGLRTQHRQLKRKEFREPQNRSTEDLVDREFLALLGRRPDADDGCTSTDLFSGHRPLLPTSREEN
ncbi:radical SAM protein [Saccharopolyspora sp. NPDC000359]|uniref:radical SAM protein n=1 Tax=Saccharopolyspora sp. NPDC000359 TaxID=3154251 RepID=UPI00332CADF7